MTTSTTITTVPAPDVAPRGRLYLLEARYEWLKALRLPAYSVPTVAFPLVFYCLFGLAFGPRAGSSFPMATYLLATYGVFGVIGASLFGFGVGVAVERGQGWMLLKRATPMPPAAYFVAKTAMALAFSLAIVVGLFALGAGLGGVRLPTATWLSLAGVLLSGAIPFCAFGLALGYLTGPNSAPAIVNLIFLPMAFASGLWFPIQALPEWLQAVAPWLPFYYFGQLALHTVDLANGVPPGRAVAVLAAFTAVSLAAARWGYRRDQGKTWG